jgi:hypothetical protein
VNPSDPSVAFNAAIDLLTTKIGGLEYFNRKYPGYGGASTYILLSNFIVRRIFISTVIDFRSVTNF